MRGKLIFLSALWKANLLSAMEYRLSLKPDLWHDFERRGLFPVLGHLL